MKKIINNKVYDTDTARELGRDGGGDGFSRWTEALYQKRTGEFFLHGEGGPMTHYAVTISDNSWSGGEKIIPLSPAAAREWAEKHLSVDAYAEIFGLPDEEETEETTALNIKINSALMAKLRNAAADQGKSLTAMIEDLIRAF